MEPFFYIVHIFQVGGLVMYPLLILSILTVSIGIERLYYYHLNLKKSKLFIHGIYHAVKGEKWDMVSELCREYPGALGRIIRTGLDYKDNEVTMRGAFTEQMTIEVAGLKRYLDYVSAIVTISPLLGLLGTVTGMITTFSVLDTGGGAMAITGGIGEALIATAFGLCVAIIAFAIYTYFSHRLDCLLTDAEHLCIIVLTGMKREWSRLHV